MDHPESNDQNRKEEVESVIDVPVRTTNLAWKIGIAVFPALAGLALLGDSLRSALEPEADWGVRTSALLYIVMAGLGGMWIANASNEEALIDHVVAPRRDEQPSPYTMALLAGLVSCVIAVLVVTTHWLTIFSVVFVIYCVVDVVLWIFRVRLLGKMFTQAKERVREKNGRGELYQRWERSMAALEKYYIESPHVWRACIVAVFGVLFLGVRLFGPAMSTETNLVVVNLAFVLLIVGSEVPITYWRIRVSEAVHQAGVGMRDLPEKDGAEEKIAE